MEDIRDFSCTRQDPPEDLTRCDLPVHLWDTVHLDADGRAVEGVPAVQPL